jgi:hypothetical protein
MDNSHVFLINQQSKTSAYYLCILSSLPASPRIKEGATSSTRQKISNFSHADTIRPTSHPLRPARLVASPVTVTYLAAS